MRVALTVVVVLVLLVAGCVAYMTMIGNSWVVTELTEHPMGERAERAMLLTFPDGETIPVNYLREGNRIYVGADGLWWRAFEGDGVEVSLLVQGQKLLGHATVELEDQAFVDDVFSRLRPAAPEWLPDWANGKLVIVELKLAGD
ncbi:MAG: hypothetical protein ACNYPE_06520 [Candidatus Azotimanducaceae bacterium WSBS_2022_MAG_OTU7]